MHNVTVSHPNTTLSRATTERDQKSFTVTALSILNTTHSHTKCSRNVEHHHITVFNWNSFTNQICHGQSPHDHHHVFKSSSEALFSFPFGGNRMENRIFSIVIHNHIQPVTNKLSEYRDTHIENQNHGSSEEKGYHNFLPYW